MLLFCTTLKFSPWLPSRCEFELLALLIPNLSCLYGCFNPASFPVPVFPVCCLLPTVDSAKLYTSDRMFRRQSYASPANDSRFSAHNWILGRKLLDSELCNTAFLWSSVPPASVSKGWALFSVPTQQTSLGQGAGCLWCCQPWLVTLTDVC